MPGPGMAVAGVTAVTVGLWEGQCGVCGVGKSGVLALCGGHFKQCGNREQVMGKDPEPGLCLPAGSRSAGLGAVAAAVKPWGWLGCHSLGSSEVAGCCLGNRALGRWAGTQLLSAAAFEPELIQAVLSIIYRT